MPNLMCPGKTKRDLVDPADPLPIQAQCDLLGLSRSSYYYASQRKEVASALKNTMLEIYEERPFYGHRRMRVALGERGYALGRKQTLRLMRELKLKVLGPKLKTTRSAKAHPKYPYLLRNLPITQPNQVWCADITYLNTPWGYLYFVGILDWATRKVLSWRISNTMSKQFCCEALEEALKQYGKPAIFNTDQGSQFTSAEFTGLLEAKGIQISMNGKGRCTDNVIVERFFGSMKWEEYHWGNYANAQEVKDGIKRYCEFYNTRRHHSSLGYATPDQVYFQALQRVA